MYELVVRESFPLGVDPSSAIESESFFRNLLENYEGEDDVGSVSTWLKQQIVKHFLTIHERPKWIQNPEWPIIDDKPMIFVNQVDLSVKNK